MGTLPSEGSVDVAELIPEVIVWNRKFMRELNGRLLDDPRVKVYEGDVMRLLNEADADTYNGILLDIDNGPTAMVQADNTKLYDPHGLERLKNVLRPGGLIAFWSAKADQAFAKLVRKAGFEVEAVPTKAYPTARKAPYVIYYARTRG